MLISQLLIEHECQNVGYIIQILSKFSWWKYFAVGWWSDIAIISRVLLWNTPLNFRCFIKGYRVLIRAVLIHLENVSSTTDKYHILIDWWLYMAYTVIELPVQTVGLVINWLYQQGWQCCSRFMMWISHIMWVCVHVVWEYVRACFGYVLKFNAWKVVSHGVPLNLKGGEGCEDLKLGPQGRVTAVEFHSGVAFQGDLS